MITVSFWMLPTSFDSFVATLKALDVGHRAKAHVERETGLVRLHVDTLATLAEISMAIAHYPSAGGPSPQLLAQPASWLHEVPPTVP